MGISALEAHLKSGTGVAEPSATTEAPALPDLTSKQEMDLKMIKRGELTLDGVKTRLKRGIGFPPKPMPDDEVQAYISALEAHLGGATNAATTTTTTTKPKDRFLRQVEVDFVAQK